jgi:hypothetical protein
MKKVSSTVAVTNLIKPPEAAVGGWWLASSQQALEVSEVNVDADVTSSLVHETR